LILIKACTDFASHFKYLIVWYGYIPGVFVLSSITQHLMDSVKHGLLIELSISFMLLQEAKDQRMSEFGEYMALVVQYTYK
jgi:hypothetical protein